MFETRIHGRGGQGVVTAAEMLSVAAFSEGKYSQAFPTFGSERMGAPVVSFCRWDEKPIRLREPIRKPDALIVQDASLMSVIDVFEGFNPAGFLLINSSRSVQELGLTRAMDPQRHFIVPASSIALRCVGKPLPNACLLGAFAGITGLLDLKSVVKAIRDRFPGKIGAANEEAARAAYELVLERQGVPCVETA